MTPGRLLRLTDAVRKPPVQLRKTSAATVAVRVPSATAPGAEPSPGAARRRRAPGAADLAASRPGTSPRHAPLGLARTDACTAPGMSVAPQDSPGSALPARPRGASREKPHDRLFKAVFASPANALAELRAVLPPVLFRALEAGSLEAVPPGFVDAKLGETQQDVLLRGRLAGRVAYFPFEHRSTGQRLLALRVLRYADRVWEAELRRSPRARRLPAVLPVVVHQGPHPFRGPRSIGDLVGLPRELQACAAGQLPELVLVVDDLGATSAGAIAARDAPPLVRLALLVLKAARQGTRALETLEETTGAVRELLAEPGGRDNLDMLLRYVYLVTTGISRRQLCRRLARIYPPEAKSTVLTIGEQLIAQGEARGLARGKAQGKAEGMRRIVTLPLRARFGRLPATATARIGTAPTLAAVFRSSPTKARAPRRSSPGRRPNA